MVSVRIFVARLLLAFLLAFLLVPAGADVDVGDIIDWFLELITSAPKVIAKCVINDVRQVMNTISTVGNLTCGFEAFENVVSGRVIDNEKVFVFDTEDIQQLKSELECADPNIKELITTSDTLLTVKAGLRKANVASYIAVCYFEKVKDTCFERNTKACLILDPTADLEQVYNDCFGNQNVENASPVGTTVSLDSITAGDNILTETTDGKLFIDSVVVNMHRQSKDLASLVTIQHTDQASITVTPDHLVWADGVFKPAHEVHKGSVLSGGHVVDEVVRGETGDIINPVTFKGTILTSDGRGAPVLSATATVRFGHSLLFSKYKPYALSFAVAKVFPSSVQSYYDTVLDPLFCKISPTIASITNGMPDCITIAFIAVADMVLVVGFIMFILNTKLFVMLYLLAVASILMLLAGRLNLLSESKSMLSNKKVN